MTAKKAQVFISYAHADDPTCDGRMPGWVTNFVVYLQYHVKQFLGDHEVEYWMDHNSEPQRGAKELLRQRVQESDCMIAFMSPNYLKSEYCRDEMDDFINLVGGGSANDRVFLVGIGETERNAWHVGIQSITEIKFWSKSLESPTAKKLGWPVPIPHEFADREYFYKLISLADNLANQIRKLTPKSSAASSLSASPLPATPPLSVVINADTPDRELGEQVQAMLTNMDVDSTLTAEQTPTQIPADYLRDMESQLKNHDGVLIVYGRADLMWVQTRCAAATKVRGRSHIGIWGALLDGPPASKINHGIIHRNLMLLDCRYDIAVDQLKQFVETLRK